MRVIINADDFGYSTVINHAIEEAILSHKISSSTIIANGPAFDEAIAIAKKYNYISFGVHLNIIEFTPLTNAEIFRQYKLLDEKGHFVEGAALCLSDYPIELKNAIKEEWREQINKVLKTGISISHFDSHQHTHAVNALQDVLIELMKEFRVSKVRRQGYSDIIRLLRVRNYKLPAYDKTNAVIPRKRSLVYRLWNHLVLLPIKHYKWVRQMKSVATITDDIMCYQLFVQDVSCQKCRLKNKTIELESHPGLLPNEEETNMLMHDELKKYVSYDLINYWKL